MASDIDRDAARKLSQNCPSFGKLRDKLREGCDWLK